MVTDWMIERKMPQSHWEVLLEQWILTEEEEEKNMKRSNSIDDYLSRKAIFQYIT